MLDVRTAETQLEDLVRDTVLYALGRRLPSVASVAELRAQPTTGATGSARRGTDLTCVVSGGVVETAFRWDPLSTAADDGATIVKPSDAGDRGRWVKWTSPVTLAVAVGSDSSYLHQIASGPLQRVIVIDRDMDADEISQLLLGSVPAVAIEAHGDVPSDMTLDVGARWDTQFTFTTYVVCESLRGRREAAQGSSVAGESSYGANAIDGVLQALLAGTQLSLVEDGVRSVQVGRGANWRSDLGQRRVIRSREYVIFATVENPQAPNDTAPFTDALAQPQMAAPDSSLDDFDPDNYLTAGMAVAAGSGLTQAISAGSAVVGGAAVSYAGGSATFEAWADTYRDLNPDGTLTLTAVPNNSPAPDLAAGSLRVGMTSTDGDSVTSDVVLAAYKADYGPPMDLQE